MGRQNSYIDRQFVQLSSALTNEFPQLELQCNLQQGTNRFRYTTPQLAPRVFELHLGFDETHELLHEAIFTLKEEFQMFDA